MQMDLLQEPLHFSRKLDGPGGEVRMPRIPCSYLDGDHQRCRVSRGIFEATTMIPSHVCVRDTLTLSLRKCRIGLALCRTHLRRVTLLSMLQLYFSLFQFVNHDWPPPGLLF